MAHACGNPVHSIVLQPGQQSLRHRVVLVGLVSRQVFWGRPSYLEFARRPLGQNSMQLRVSLTGPPALMSKSGCGLTAWGC